MQVSKPLRNVNSWLDFLIFPSSNLDHTFYTAGTVSALMSEPRHMSSEQVELIEILTKFNASSLVNRQLSQSQYIHDLLESQLNVSTKSWGELANF